MKIPVLNCNRIYVNSHRISLLVDNKKNYTVTNDGWSILKFCDGTKDICDIYDIVSREFEIDKKDFLSFFEKAERINIIKYISKIGKIEFKIYGGNNKSFPQSFAIELTNRCNLECKYCYGNYKRSTGIFLNFDTITYLFKSMMENGVITIELTGGEPLLHPNFKEILILALKCFYRVNILSNGVLFTDEIFDIIKDNIDKVYLQISIDGCTEETNKKVRGVNNTWNKTLHTLIKLESIGAKYRVPFMVTKDNIHEIENVCELFKQKNIKNLIFSPVSSSFGRACDSLECKFEADNENYLYNISQIMLERYPDIFHRLLNYKNELPIARDNCGSGWQHATISPTGTVKFCVIMNDCSASMGNIYEQNISKIFNSEKAYFYANFSKQIDDECCISCEYYGSCGNCIARIYMANIDRLKKGKELCNIVKKNKYG